MRFLISFLLILACLNPLVSKQGCRRQLTGRGGTAERLVQRVYTEDSEPEILKSPSFIVGLRAGMQFPSLDQWRSQFSPKPPGEGYMVGVEAGFILGHMLRVGAGYEYFSTRTIKAKGPPDLQDMASTSFFYGSLGAGTRLEFHDKLFLYGAVDAGLLSATEKVEVTGYQEAEATGDVLAVRPKIGLLFMFHESVSVSGELAYQWANVKTVKLAGSTLPGYSLDFSGVSVLMSLDYHLPL